ncbi:hypothetical protein TWF970_007252 [Orbilia oligospora]|uniref:Uncharacterized protein n=1 Tax=Orbilia oligospora TaxID=2813651 RepID=A0A7C8VFR6_ORBOL|nr:hypothetical protein TWF970_007252 [Orbilia oligospora]
MPPRETLGYGYIVEGRSKEEDDDYTIDTRVERDSTIDSTSTSATSVPNWDDPSFEEYCHQDDNDGEATGSDKEAHYGQLHRRIDKLSPLPGIEPLRPRKVKILRRAIGSSNLKSRTTCEFVAAEPINPYREGLQWSIKRNRRWW